MLVYVKNCILEGKTGKKIQWLVPLQIPLASPWPHPQGGRTDPAFNDLFLTTTWLHRNIHTRRDGVAVASDGPYTNHSELGLIS